MRIRRWHKQVLVSVMAALATVVALLVGGVASQADPGHPYLALGDSVSFGYITQAGFEYQNPDNFIGFPNYVGQALGMTPTNAACPGEATAGFSSATGADNGCRQYKANFPLHASYSGTQLAFATAFLNAHPNTKLVTIQLGANDLFLLENQCGGQPACITAGLPALARPRSATTWTPSIARFARPTSTAGSSSSTTTRSTTATQTGTGVTQALNQAIASHAHADGAIVADAFTAFEHAAASAGGQTCKAGLLNTTPGDQLTCDVHPSQSGQQLLAQAVENAYGGPTGN